MGFRMTIKNLDKPVRCISSCRRPQNFQPVSLTGRMGKKEREKYRITIPDCIERIQEQTNGEVSVDDWFPVPSCMPMTNVIEAFSKKPKYELSIHFACGAGTYVFEDTQTKKLIPLTSFVDLKGVLEYFEEKADEIKSGANRYWSMLQVIRKSIRDFQIMK